MGDSGAWREKLRQQLAGCPEPMPGQPLVEIAGHGRVLIENHRGVCCYGCEEIRIRVSYGQIAVTGSGLELARMSREVVVITGRIENVTLHREVSR